MFALKECAPLFWSITDYHYNINMLKDFYARKIGEEVAVMKYDSNVPELKKTKHLNCQYRYLTQGSGSFSLKPLNEAE